MLQLLSNILVEQLDIYLHSQYFFSWQAITSVQPWSLRHVTEALLITKHRSVLNKQVLAFHVSPFPMGITANHEHCSVLKPSHKLRSNWDAHAQVQKRCACAGPNEMRMRRSKWDAHAQVQMRWACAGQNEMRMRRSKWDAHAQVKMRCACAGQNELGRRRSKWDGQAQVKMRCACAGQNGMRMHM